MTTLTDRRAPVLIELGSVSRGTKWKVPLTRWMPTTVPGIIITPHHDGEGFADITREPCLTHHASGGLIGGPYVSVEQARLVAIVLANLIHNEWDKSMPWVREFALRRATQLGVIDYFRKITKPQINWAGEELEWN